LREDRSLGSWIASEGKSDQNYRKLRGLLAELFQLEQTDLDFGIYRVMNTHRADILKFLDEDLLPDVQKAFQTYQSSDRESLDRELKEAVAGAQKLGVKPEASAVVQELRARLAVSVQDPSTLESQVFSDLYTFFRRYYSEGDFVSQRRFKEGVYAIPYEGEEVKLYWANQDQHYIKTDEYLKHYVFTTPDRRRVRFELSPRGESDGAHGEGLESRFVLRAKDPVEVSKTVLTIWFEHRPDLGRRKQVELDRDAAEIVLASKNLGDWLPSLRTKAPSEAEPDQTVLAKHIHGYTARNTSDYFIHHDLGTFLRRELDYFIKNEVVHLDDLDGEVAERVLQRLTKVRVLRSLGSRIIEFLAQLEDFEQSLWLKRKFVLETQYCITLDRVPPELYTEIAANDAQRKDWVALFAIDEIGGTLSEKGYSVPLSAEFLKANLGLVLDTRHFSREFRDRLLASVKDIDQSLDGVLVCSENYQALRLLEPRWTNRIDNIYIDPPFNTAATEILYKNNYKHSSWLSMISGRVEAARRLMTEEGILCVAIDDAEFAALSYYLGSAFGEEARLATVVVRSNPHGRAMAAGFSSNHEYAMFFANGGQAVVGRLPRGERGQARYPDKDEIGSFTWINFRGTGAHTRRVDRPKLFYPAYASKQGVRIPRMQWQADTKEWRILERPAQGETVVLPIDSEKNERVWTLGSERAREEASNNLEARETGKGWQIHRKYRPNQEGALPPTWWEDAKYSATESGTRILKEMFGNRENFSYPKSIYLVEDCLRASNCRADATVLDFFAGSGTTAHAVINLNRQDGGRRKYILVEMAEYFESVLLPRVLKAIYSPGWKDGKPTARGGQTHFLKYLRLESYEDALDNLVLRPEPRQRNLLEDSDDARRQYFLRYILDRESRGNATLVDLEMFKKPLEYSLSLAASQQARKLPVDLIETFNYLLGLKVVSYHSRSGFITIGGEDANGDTVLVIWRNVGSNANELLVKFCTDEGYLLPTAPFATIYVNGDTTLEAHRPDGANWHVRLTENEFRRRMFAAQP
jgi:adenine-specific DNA-methyltransferase